MIRNATVRELSLVPAFCQFFHFLIYNSVRFVYISFTFLCICFFPAHLPKSRPAIFTVPFVPFVASH